MWAYVGMAALQLLSSSQQAASIQMQADLARKLDDFNIAQAEIDAFNAEADGYTMQARYQSSIDAVEADQRVSYYSMNVDPTFGTAADVQEDTKLTGALNLLDIQSQAHQRALGYKKEANQRRGQSGMNQIGASLQASTARNTGAINALGTTITGYERTGGFDFKKDKPVERGHFGGVNEDSYNVQFGGYTSKYLGRLGG